jgi:Bacterial Ig domain
MNKPQSAQRARWSLWSIGVLAASLLAGCGGGSGEGAIESATAIAGAEGRARALALAPPANSGGMNGLTDGTFALRLVSAPGKYLNAPGTEMTVQVVSLDLLAGAQVPASAQFLARTFLNGLGRPLCATLSQTTSVDAPWPIDPPPTSSVTMLARQERSLRHINRLGANPKPTESVLMGQLARGSNFVDGQPSSVFCPQPETSGRGFRLVTRTDGRQLTLRPDGSVALALDDGSTAFAASAVWEAINLNVLNTFLPVSVTIRESLPAGKATVGEPVALRVDSVSLPGFPVARQELFNGYERVSQLGLNDGVVRRLNVGDYRWIVRATDTVVSSYGTSQAMDYQVLPAPAPAGYAAPRANLSEPGAVAGSVSVQAGSAVTLIATPSGGTSSIKTIEYLDGGTVVAHATKLPARWLWAPPVGVHNMAVRVTDHYGNQTTSPRLVVTVSPLPAGSAPLTRVFRSVTNMAEGTAPEGQTQQLTATFDTVQFDQPLGEGWHVEFYDGVDLIGGRSNPPYSVPWTGRVGTHLLRTVVVDPAGRRSSSVPLAFVVTAGSPPTAGIAYPYFFQGTVTVNQPATGASSPAGQPLYVTLTHSGVDTNAHPRNRLELYVVDLDRLDANNQGRLEFVDSATGADLVPTTLVWRKPRAGRFGLVPRLVAAHARGVSNSRGVVFREGSTVNAVLQPEFLTQVTIGAPAPAQSQLFSPPPDTVVQLGQGLILRARATGSDGTSATAASVRFLVNGQVIDSQGPASSHSTAWLPTAAGSFTVASIVTDSVTGAQITSAPVTLHAVAAGGFPAITRPWNWAPGVSLTSPANAARVAAGSAVTVRALAEDIGGRVTQVVLRSNTGDVELPGVSGSLSQYGKAAYERTWTASTVAGPTATFWAEATDDLGATTITPKVSIAVLPSTANRPPSVSLTSAPALPGVLTVGTRFVLRATAADTDGRVVKVEYFNNGQPMGTATQAPWRVDGVATWVGPHRITARATDDQGATTTTSGLLMQVLDPRAPTVRVFGAPALPGTLTVGTPFALRADTSNAAAQMVKVEYFDNGRLLGVVNQAPWRLDGVASWVGPHRITARATDAQGNTSTSPEVLMQVVAAK